MGAPEYVARLAEVVSLRRACATAVVTRTEGSTLAKPGFKILVADDGKVLGGTLGGGCPEGPIVEVALRAMRDGEPRVLRVHLVDATKAVAGTLADPNEDEIYVETNCGGTLEVFVEPMLPAERLVVVGQGGKDDVEDALVHLGKALGLEVVVVDPAPALREEPDVVVKAAELDPTIPIGDRDYVVVLTKGERDVAVLEALSRSNAKFVGLLASRHRLRKNLDDLRKLGVREGFLASLHAPVGLDIGAKTPAELALAILGDVIATKYGKDVPHKPMER
ncbi:MAG: XdhC family protein [Methanobacteriota archaeon]